LANKVQYLKSTVPDSFVRREVRELKVAFWQDIFSELEEGYKESTKLNLEKSPSQATPYILYMELMSLKVGSHNILHIV